MAAPSIRDKPCGKRGFRRSAVDWGQRGVATSALVFSRIIGQALGAVFDGVLNASVPAALARTIDPHTRHTLPHNVPVSVMQALAQGCIMSN